MGILSYGVDYEGQYDFLQIGTITSAQAALAVTARDNASVVALAAAKKVIWSPDQGTAAAILRFRTDGTEDQAPIIHVYAAKGADYYTRIGTLTLAQGTQDWSGGHFVDEITLSNEKWAHGIRADSVTDEIGRVVFNTGGFDRFLFIASTLAVTTIHIDIARLDKQIDHGIEIHSAILVLADNMTVSDVVSAISDMHSDLAAGIDGLSAQLSTLEDDVELVDAAVDAVESAVDLATLAADSVHSALSGIVIDAVDLATLAADSVHSALSGIVIDAVAAVETDVVAVKSTLREALISVTNSNSWVEDIASAADGTRAAVDLATLAADSVHSALSGIVIDAIDAVTTAVTNATKSNADSIIANLDLNEAGIRSGVESALSTLLGTVENDIVSIHSVALAATTFVSTGGGTEKLTIPGAPNQVAGATQACREIIIYCPSGNAGTTYLNIGGVAGVNNLPLHEDVWLSIPLNNTNLLNFFGTENDVVHLLWRN